LKITLQIKIIPSQEQKRALLDTIKEANKACNQISEIAFANQTFNKFRLQKLVYHEIRGAFNLSAQMVVRCISKVSNSYKLSQSKKTEFRASGAIAYDIRILSYSANNISIWTTEGRLKVPFICYNKEYFDFIKGEGLLVYRKGKFYISQTCDIPEKELKDTDNFIGCDFGQTDICTLSDGTNFNSKKLKEVRKKYTKVRASVQAKGTKGAKKLLKRLSGRERRFVSVNNHTISKQIVAKAIEESKGIAIEDLSNIRKTGKIKSKSQKTELNRWSFFQLRQFISYKAQMAGISLAVIPAPYTSQTCNICLHIGERNRKRFSCKNCGNTMDADHNAAKNIAAWGCVVNQPEKQSNLYCNIHDSHCLKPN